MAKVTITRHWPDGDRLQVSVGEDATYPDGLIGEVARVACETYTDALETSVAMDAIDLAEPDEQDGL